MWQEVLKIKSPMTQAAKDLVDKVITTTPKTARAILDDMYAEVERTTGKFRYSIPTSSELKRYLSRNYSKVNLSRTTGKPVKGSIGAEMHYYREADILKRGEGKKSDKFYAALNRDVVALLKQKGPLSASLIFQDIKNDRRWGRSIANPNSMAKMLMRLPDIKIRERTPGRARGIREYYLEGQ